MKKLFSPVSLDTDFATLLLRLIFGGMFIYHGWLKIQNYDAIVSVFDPIGLGPDLSLILTIFGEFVCGLLIVLGLLTRLAVIPVLITMIVAFFVAHQKDDFMNKTLPFVYMLLTSVVFVLGSGRYSIDALIFKRR